MTTDSLRYRYAVALLAAAASMRCSHTPKRGMRNWSAVIASRKQEETR